LEWRKYNPLACPGYKTLGANSSQQPSHKADDAVEVVV